MLDVQKYVPSEDINRDYRINEIDTRLLDLLQKCRVKRGAVHILPESIDKLIELQAEDIAKAELWLKWKYLGTATWLDVYGEEATEKRAEARHRLEAAEAYKTIKQLSDQIAVLTKLLAEQQQAKNSNNFQTINISSLAKKDA